MKFWKHFYQTSKFLFFCGFESNIRVKSVENHPFEVEIFEKKPTKFVSFWIFWFDGCTTSIWISNVSCLVIRTHFKIPFHYYSFSFPCSILSVDRFVEKISNLTDKFPCILQIVCAAGSRWRVRNPKKSTRQACQRDEKIDARRYAGRNQVGRATGEEKAATAAAATPGLQSVK